MLEFKDLAYVNHTTYTLTFVMVFFGASSYAHFHIYEELCFINNKRQLRYIIIHIHIHTIIIVECTESKYGINSNPVMKAFFYEDESGWSIQSK